ncbi:MAG TPA: RNA methyltransferase [Vicinamibacterales bacterium]|nr:RNA methyltransferase [Vicinamibacterales bacterium]
METIASRHNAVVKTFRALARRRAAGNTHVLLEGEHLLEEALAAGIHVSTAALASRVLTRVVDADEASVARLAERLKRHGARVLSVSESVMAAMSPVQTPSGVVAIAEVSPPQLERVVDGALPLVPLLAGVQDPGNLGAVVRTAEAAGATGLVVCPPSADPYGWKALRGAMGSTFRLPVPERVPLHEALLAARRRGLTIAAAVPRGGTSMHAFDFRRPLALMLGGEGTGLGSAELDHADERVTIPMCAPVESLNVSVSAALILYEAFRQRTHTP